MVHILPHIDNDPAPSLLQRLRIAKDRISQAHDARLKSSASQSSKASRIAKEEDLRRAGLISEIKSWFPDLSDPVITLLRSDASDDLVIEDLLNILGFDALDKISDCIQMRPTLKGTSTNESQDLFKPTSSAATLASFSRGHKLAAPQSTREEHENYTEVTIPAPTPQKHDDSIPLVPISKMDNWGKRTFASYTTLNRLQSAVYPIASQTNDNMLVCAPTGAGKTDVALLTILRCLSQLELAYGSIPPPSKWKIVYVAPLKALAAEITSKFASRLKWTNVLVREFTGDMQLTRAELDKTGIIVTTPEKWDVVSRKSGSHASDLVNSLSLLIIDEVHLLHEDRGAVIESIVARSLRQVESTQKPIRILGLSATLPNYQDVAEFLHVNERALFFFDSSYRPVPLEQHFIGVKGKPGSQESKAALDDAVFDKALDLLKEGHQLMVFVHARKETFAAAQALRKKFQETGNLELLDSHDDPHNRSKKTQSALKDLVTSRNRELRELVPQGFGIHNAGMLRADRLIAESLFEAGVIKILCTTATLAWGVNLPAYAVIIKGTQIYDAAQGKFVDLSIMDVIQIFGRAGRPQYEDKGVGYLCTSEDRLAHYIELVGRQHPVESQFVKGLADSLNAEISLGSVSTIHEAVTWLGYTYLFVRIRKNPILYGISSDEMRHDPQLIEHRTSLVKAAVDLLLSCGMINVFDENPDSDNAALAPEAPGQIASKYYLKTKSVQLFNDKLAQYRHDVTPTRFLLNLVACSDEFSQINIRQPEIKELAELAASAPSHVDEKDATHTAPGKVNVLLQAYMRRKFVNEFSLASDSSYIAQNAGRVMRAIMELSIFHKHADLFEEALTLSLAIEHKMWVDEHPLRQTGLALDTCFALDQYALDLSAHDLAEMTPEDIAKRIHLNAKHGAAVKRKAQELPSFSLNVTPQPITHDTVRLTVNLKLECLSSNSHPSWVWVTNDSGMILGASRLLVQASATAHVFHVSGLGDAFSVHLLSDRYLMNAPVSEFLDPLQMPDVLPAHTPILPLQLLRTANVLPNPAPFLGSTLGPVESQIFHSIFHTSNNVLVCAPTSSVLFTCLAFALLRQRNTKAHRAVCLVPSSTFKVWLVPLLSALKLSNEVIVLSTDSDSLSSIGSAPGIIASMFIESLDSKFETVLSQCFKNFPSARRIGTSYSLADSRDVARWLSVPDHCHFNFGAEILLSRSSLSVFPFFEAQSKSLFKSLTAQNYKLIRQKGLHARTLIVVPSADLCTFVAEELVACALADLDTGLTSFAGPNSPLYDPNLLAVHVKVAEALQSGISILSSASSTLQNTLALNYFLDNRSTVLVATKDAALSLPPKLADVQLPLAKSPISADLALVLGTQYSVLRSGARSVVKYSLQELVQLRNLCNYKHEPDFFVYCPSDDKEWYSRFLVFDGIPLESPSSFRDFADWLGPLIPQCQDVSDIIHYLSWTYIYPRLITNPHFYGNSQDNLLSEIVDFLKRNGLIRVSKSAIKLTPVGQFLVNEHILPSAVERLRDKAAISVQEKQLFQSMDPLPEKDGESLAALYARLPRKFKDIWAHRAESQSLELKRPTLSAAQYLCVLAFSAGSPVPEDLQELFLGTVQKIL